MWGYNDKKAYIVKYLLPDENFDGEGEGEGGEGGKLFFIGLISNSMLKFSSKLSKLIQTV